MPKSGEHKVGNIDSFFRQRPSINNVREGELITFLEDGKLIKQEKRNGVVYQSEFSEAIPRLSTEEVEAGVIREIIAGDGLTGGGIGGEITLNVVGGTGITANANDIAIDSTVVTLTGTQTLSNKTLASPIVTGNLVADSIDVAGDLTLDADGADIILKDGGTEYGRLSQVLGGLTLKSGSSGANAVIFSSDGNTAIFAGGVQISGDLSVAGSTTTIDTQNLVVEDRLIELAYGSSGTPSDTNDSGIIVNRGSSANIFFGWDEDSDRIRFATTDSVGTATTVNFTGNADIQAGRLYGNVTGDVTGNVTGNLTGDVTGNVTGSASLNLLKSNNLSDLANASTARSNLGLGTGAELDTAAVSDGASTLATGDAIYDHVTSRISGFVDTSGTPVDNDFAKFTDANTIEGRSASETRTDLGLVIGTNVQAHDAELDDIAAIDTSTLDGGDNDKFIAWSFSSAGFVLSSFPATQMSGSTNNGLLTYNSQSVASVESNLTFDGSTLAVNDLNIRDDGSHTFVENSTGNLLIRNQAHGSKLQFGTENSSGTLEYVLNITGDNHRVGIGTTSPTADLDLVGTAYLRTAVFSDAFKPYSGTLATYGSSSSTDHYFVGDVGIGTSSPGAKLHIAEGFAYIYQTDGVGKLELRDSRASYDAEISQRSDGRISLATRAGTYGSNGSIEILDSGNVGIGTTSPATNLEVKSTGNTTARISTDGDAGDVATLQLYRNSAAYAQMHYEAGGGANAGFHITDFRDDANSHIIFNTRGDNERMRIEGDGSVGIGTASPGANLHIYEAHTAVPELRIDNNNHVMKLQANGTASVIDSTATNTLLVRSSGTERFKISNAGAITFNNAYTFPTGIGSEKYILTAEGSNVSFFDYNSSTLTPTASGDKMLIIDVSDSNNLKIADAPVNVPNVSGTTANGVLTYNSTGGGGAVNVTTESALTFDGSTLALAGDLNVDSNTLFVDSSADRVGIGTSSPEDLLHIHSTGDTNLRIKSTSNKAQIRYQNDTQSWYTGITSDESYFWYGSEIASNAGFIQSSTGNLYWNQSIILTANAKYLYSRDASSGLTRMFGMNSSNNTYIGPIDSYAGGSILYGASSNVADQIFYTSGSERLRIKATTGNVGIGTNSPTSLLTTSGGDIRILGSNNRLRFNTNGSIYWDSSVGVKLENASSENITIETNTSGDIYLNTANTRTMTITDDKEVFVGSGVENDDLVLGGTLKTHQYLDTRDYMQHKGHFAESDWIVMESGQDHVVTSYFDNTNVYVDGVYKAKIDSAFGQATISASDLSLGSVISADRAVVVHQSGTIRAMCMNERFSGRILGSANTRGQPLVIHIYAPYTSVSYEIFIGTSANTDITGTPETSGTISQGGIVTYTETGTTSQTQYYVIVADGKVCATLDDGSGDHLLFTPLSMEVIASAFSRESKGGITDAAGSTSISETQNVNAYYLKDTTGKHGLFATGTADGAGSEAEFAMPIEFCSDYYIYGSTDLSHYRLVCFQDTFVKVLDASGTVLYTHDGSAATKNAPLYFDNGTATGSGTLSTAGPFRFVGTAPFYLVCQEPGDQDEATMLGAIQHELSNNQRFKGGYIPNATTIGAKLEISNDVGHAQNTVLVIKSDDSDGDQGASSTADIDFHIWDSNTRLSTPQARIGVVGDGTASQDSEAGGRLAFYTNVESYSSPSLTERMRIDASGNVGIGETNPDSPLHIGNNVATSAGFDSFADYQILLYDTGTSTTSYGMGIRANTFMFNSDVDFEWRSDNSAKMFLDGANGRLGIGTTSPGSILHIGTGNTSRHIKVSDNRAMFGYNGSNAVVQGGNTKGIQFHTNTDTFSGSAKMTITSAGNVGIGETSIDANLHITGSPVVIKMERAGHRAMRMGTPDNSSLFVFADADDLKSNQRMVIDNTGNVGIGTTSPGALLHIDEDDNVGAFLVKGGGGGTYLGRFQRDVGGSAYVDIHCGSDDPQITFTDSGASRQYSIGADSSFNGFKIAENSSIGTNDRFGINDAGQVLVGTSISNRSSVAGYSPIFQTEAAGAAGYVQIVDSENGQFHGGSLALHKYRSGGIVANTELGSIWFGGTDSANSTFAQGALIRAYAEGADSGSNVATNVRFFTNTGSAVTEAMRIESDQDVHFDKDVIAFSTTPSDKRLKTNINDINYGLDAVMKLSPKEYDWKKDNRHDIGFIAQEVEEVIPEIVKDKKHFDKDIKTLDYEKLTAVLIKAVQEQQEQINELKEKLNG